MLEWRRHLPKRWRRLFLPTLLIVAWITSATIWLPPVTTEPFGSADSRTQVEHELQGFGAAVLPPDEALPSTLPDNLQANRSLVDSYQSNRINKIPSAQLGSQIQAGILEHDSHNDRFQIQSSAPFTLNILTAYFPGWRATLSGRLIPLRPNAETGLIQVDVPQTRTSELVVTLGTTPIRLGAWIITAACLLMVVIVTWGKWRRHRTSYENSEQLRHPETRLLSVLFASFAVIVLIINNPSFPSILRPKPGYTLQNSLSVQSRTNSGLSLLAFRLGTNQYQAGDSVPLTLYWQAQQFLIENYQAQVSITNNQTRAVWSQSDYHDPGNYPTRRWHTGLFVTDTYTLLIPPDTPPGNYQIRVELSTCNPDCTSGGHVTFFNIDGQMIGTTLILPTLMVVRE